MVISFGQSFTNQVRADGCTGSWFDMIYSPSCGCFQVCGNFISDCSSIFDIDWNFGDGTTASGEDPCHIFNTPGTYTVTMTVSGWCHFGTQTCDISQQITVTPAQAQNPGIIADFSADTSCFKTVRFTDQSVFASRWRWDFGDGSTHIGNNPTHTYNECGTYLVTMIAEDNTCCFPQRGDTIIKPVVIPCLPAVIDTACLGSPTSFSSDPQGVITNWLWEFSDGGSSTMATPTHIYGACNEGIFDNQVKLTVTNDQGCTDFDWFDVMVWCIVEENNFVVDNVSCFGDANGAASVSPIGGTPPYTYVWSDPANTTGPSVSGLSGDVYNVSITDARNCLMVDSVEILEPALFEGVVTAVDIECFGWTTGTAVLNMSGGTSPNIYQWSNGETVPNIEGLGVGTYFVTAFDANGCSYTDQGTLDQNPEIGNNGSSTPSDCSACDGTATASGTGGTGSYTYQWDAAANNQTSATATNLCSGIYSVVITDASVPGCSRTFAQTVDDSGGDPLTVSTTQVNCPDACDGTATVRINGGACPNPPCQYQWFDSIGTQISALTTDVATGLCVGNYIVLVQNGSDCISSQNFSITAVSPMSLSLTPNNPNCPVNCDGTVQASVSGGQIPFAYQWFDGNGAQIGGQVGPTLTNACGGDYTVRVTDNGGCIIWDSTTLVEPIFQLSATSSDGICNGDCAGAATSTVLGGVAPINYQWLDAAGAAIPGETNRNIFNLCAGTYSVRATDQNGCVLTSNQVTIVDPAPVTVSGSGTDVTCFGTCDGTANAIAAGGNPPYVYEWQDTNGLAIPGYTADNISVLCAGTNFVVARDSNGCPSNAEPINIGTPDEMLTSAAITEIGCNGATLGAIDLTVTGGIAGYSFSWNNGAYVTEDLNNIPQGTYAVEVTDQNGCVALDTFGLFAPPPLTTSIWLNTYAGQNHISCFSFADAFAAVTATGGVPGYQYEWSDPNNQVTDTVYSLDVGVYTVTVTDSTGCAVVDTLRVTNEPPPFVLTAVVTDVGCAGDSTGAIDITMSGGSPPYFAVWNNGTLVVNDRVNLPVGDYDVYAIDSNECIVLDTFTVSEPLPLSSAVTAQIYPGGNNVSCYGASDGNIDLTVSGGTPPFTFDWNGGQYTTEDPSGLIAGTYIVDVIDSNGCTISDTIVLDEPPRITSTTELLTYAGGSHVSCFGATDGATWVSVLGGRPPYSYSWNDPANQQNDTASALGIDTYIVTITDSTGCRHLDTSILSIEPTELLLNESHVDVLCNGDATGSIDLTASGSTPPYAYDWNNGAFTTEDLNNIPQGTYSVVVTDTNACVAYDTIQINEPDSLSSSVTALVYPGGNNVSCFGAIDGEIDLTVAGGVPPYSYDWNSGFSTVQDPSGVAPGDYFVTITDSNGCTINDSISLSEPPEIFNSFTLHTYVGGSHVSCFGATDGSIIAIPTGGRPPFSYSWSDPMSQTNDTASALALGTYSVTVTDSTGCQLIDTVTIDLEPTELLLSNTIVHILCYGDSTASIDLIASGSTPPYSYDWNNGFASTEDLSALPIGTYTVEVTDTNNCIARDTAIVTEPTELQSSVSATVYPGGVNISCFGFSDGMIDLTITGGVAPYAYDWNSGFSADEDPANVTAGLYTVEVTDSNGCAIRDTILLVEPTQLTDTITALWYPGVVNVSCFGATDGSLTVVAGGGFSPYTYSWNDGTAQTTATAIDLALGTYTVTITDSVGCTLIDSLTIDQEPTPLVLTETHVDVLCWNDSTGSIDLTATGSTPPYTYSWSPGGETSQDLTNLPEGTYEVLVIDTNACEARDTVDIVQPIEIYFFHTIQICTRDSFFAGGAYQNTAGTYLDTLVATNGCDSIRETELQIVNTLTTTVAEAICDDDSFFVGGAWQSTAGAYIDSFVTRSGCDSVVTTNLSILSRQYATVQDTICDGDSILLGGALQDTAGSYIDILTAANGCDSILTTQLTVLGVSSTGDTLEICPGTETTITAEAGFTTYLWAPSGETTQSIVVPAGNYSVDLTNFFGCALTVDYLVTNAEDLDIFGLPDTVTMLETEPAEVIILSNAIDNWIDSIAWFPGDGVSCPGGDCSDVRIQPEDDVNYIVVAWDPNGCTDTTVIEVTVLFETDIFAPNVFTPNGDGFNDEFLIFGSNIEVFHLQIFNRWGEMVFETFDITQGWDGTYKGKMQEPGVYVYNVEAFFKEGMTPTDYERYRKGSVTMIR